MRAGNIPYLSRKYILKYVFLVKDKELRAQSMIGVRREDIWNSSFYLFIYLYLATLGLRFVRGL